MAFCTSCGAKIDENAKFCVGCGNPTGSSLTPPAPAPAVATAAPAAADAGTPVLNQSAPPGSASLQALPAKKSSPVVKIVIAVLIVLLVIGAIAAGLIGYTAYKLKQRVQVNGDSVTINTPDGQVTMGGQTAGNLDIEKYPGAKVTESGSSSFGGIGSTGVEMETSDAVAKVVSFYKSKYPNSTLQAEDDSHQTIGIIGKAGIISVEITGEEGKTRISITKVGASSDSSE